MSELSICMKAIARLFYRATVVLAILWLGARLASPSLHAAASADLSQARNGASSAPVSPVQWVKGNAGPANSHYAEGHSIPYRIVLTGVSLGPHNLVIEW